MNNKNKLIRSKIALEKQQSLFDFDASTSKIIQHGSTLYVAIDRNLVQHYKLNAGDVIKKQYDPLSHRLILNLLTGELSLEAKMRIDILQNLKRHGAQKADDLFELLKYDDSEYDAFCDMMKYMITIEKVLGADVDTSLVWVIKK